MKRTRHPASNRAVGASSLERATSVPRLRPNADARAETTRRFGNRGTEQFLRSRLQTKLTVSVPSDVHEQEADSVGEEVMRRPGSAAPKPAVDCEHAVDDERELRRADVHALKDEDEPVLARAGCEDGQSDERVGADLEQELPALPGNGTPLPDAVRTFMEPRFGADFGAVRVHDDARAHALAQSIHAQAFTVGTDIVFGTGYYAPFADSGKRLLAHELAHVVQQTGQPVLQDSNRPVVNKVQRAIDDPRTDEVTTFVSQPEAGLPQSLIDKYLTAPSLMAAQRALIRALVRRVQLGEAPLTQEGLQALARHYESDPGTALIVCHNVAKALSKGESPIDWKNVSRAPAPLVYSLDGVEYHFDADRFHPEASRTSSRSQESVFYAMLASSQFGERDENDWYHYYAIAAAAYFRTHGQTQTPSGGAPEPMVAATDELVRKVADALRDPSVVASQAYEAWVWANSVSFLEGGFFGRSQSDIDAESHIHIRAASGELARLGRIPGDVWVWYVPKFRGIALGDLATFRLRREMIQAVRSGIDGCFELTVVRGTTPDAWYDTPEPYVKLPGFFGSRTTVKDDTTTPVWNEALATMTYAQLASVELEMIDEDALLNDHIADFVADLRPAERRSIETTLSADDSTLDVKVSAVGDVVVGETSES